MISKEALHQCQNKFGPLQCFYVRSSQTFAPLKPEGNKYIVVVPVCPVLGAKISSFFFFDSLRNRLWVERIYFEQSSNRVLFLTQLKWPFRHFSNTYYSRTPPCGHPTFVDTPPLWTLFARPVCFPYIILLDKFH